MPNNDNIFVLNREATSEPFVAQLSDEVTITATHLADVDQFELARIFGTAGLTDLEFITAVFNLALDEENLAALRKLKLKRRELAALYAAYKDHCGTKQGESPASSS